MVSNGNYLDTPTREDIVDAVKTIYDKLKIYIDNFEVKLTQIRDAIDKKMWELENTFNKMLQESSIQKALFDKKLIELQNTFDKMLHGTMKHVDYLGETVKILGVETKGVGEIAESMKRLQMEFKCIEGSIATRLGSQFEKMVQDQSSQLHGHYEQKMLTLHGAYDNTMQQVKSLLQSLPAPVVNVSVPEQQVPQVNVNIPEQKTPEVNITLPEQSPPQIQVNVPRARPIKKHITYDDLGRPETITESQEE